MIKQGTLSVLVCLVVGMTTGCNFFEDLEPPAEPLDPDMAPIGGPADHLGPFDEMGRAIQNNNPNLPDMSPLHDADHPDTNDPNSLPDLRDLLAHDIGPDAMHQDPADMDDLQDPDLGSPLDMAPDLNTPTCCTSATRTVSISVTGGFYRADPLDSPGPPSIVNLANSGFCPGDTLQLVSIGEFRPCPGNSPCRHERRQEAVALFSRNGQLRGPQQVHRIPDAVPSNAPPYSSANTTHSDLPTDIPEDFQITPAGLTVDVPSNASHIFLGVRDSTPGDNRGDSLSVTMRCIP